MGARPRTELSDLSQILWHERETLELVLFRLAAQRLLLRDGQDRWLCHASRELDAALDDLGAMELNRAVTAASVAASLGLADSAPLRELAAAAPQPWPSVIERHVGALVRLADEVVDLAAANRALLADGLRAVRQAMASRTRRPSTRMLVDAAVYDSALAITDRVLQPSLVDAVWGDPYAS